MVPADKPLQPTGAATWRLRIVERDRLTGGATTCASDTDGRAPASPRPGAVGGDRHKILPAASGEWRRKAALQDPGATQ